ncbi:hypothetical protein Pla52o_51450 [Novipirellula galeiformis]|uniref:Uncharacterized protein n=1 Tax=Novipirellula galeiformis TaxID=2528004 RepID=A0A5C6C132_9BACT|nr:hypothetical protein [Novipirellula galeiformis]TWU17341.1 hypothetical protein Pla52o_51450 [Novipirellula galeiformis]
MAKINDFDNLFSLLDAIKANTDGCETLERASGAIVDVIFAEFQHSLVLTRMFATIPYEGLPPQYQQFVDKLANDAGVSNQITPQTPVLSLIASRGIQSAWNDHRRSEGHLGIPLVSGDFVSRVPMIARLLSEVGLDLSWLGGDASGLEIDTLSKLSGVFYVADAASAVDSQGRKIISAQAFVQSNRVKSVFGVGGGFAISKTFLTLLFFCNERVERAKAMQFLPLISTVKALTADAAVHKKFFD